MTLCNILSEMRRNKDRNQKEYFSHSLEGPSGESYQLLSILSVAFLRILERGCGLFLISTAGKQLVPVSPCSKKALIAQLLCHFLFFQY